MSKVQERNRLTCVLNLYHEQDDEQPEGFRLAFSDKLHLSSQRYNRRLKIGEDPVALDVGWFSPDEIGTLLVENLEGTRFSIVPSEEELADVAKRIIHVYHPGSPSWLIPPRRFLLAHPEDASGLLLRCGHGRARVSLTIIPR
jgi:hypothetical protein